jgi:hypothetical protein
MIEYEEVLRYVEQIMQKLAGGVVGTAGQDDQYRGSLNAEEATTPLLNPNTNAGDLRVVINQIAGTIDSEDRERMKKLIFRATRGKAVVYFQEIAANPNNANKGLDLNKKIKQRSVYVVVFQDVQQMRDRIVKVVDSFMGQRFDVPPIGTLRNKMAEIRRHIEESKNLRITSRRFLHNYLVQINQIQNANPDRNDNKENPSALEVYKWFITKEKAIYSSINFMR